MFGLFSQKLDTSEPIYFFDTASNEKRIFESIKAGEVMMYSCGPTVYDHAHIGNLSAYLLPDLIKRVLEYNGYRVKNTINFTDFGHLTDDGDGGEDKMMKALKRERKPITLESMRDVAEVYIQSFKADLNALNVLPPNQYTPASEYVREQIALVKTLVEKGYGYETSDGVYFDVSKFPAYGMLGNVDINELKAGARVEINPEKRHPADFALWKKGDLGWESAWGKGFPGWHTECTAMIFATLGKQIDIHTGGQDLMYTHHNSEIAQAESVTGKTFVNYWMHNALMTVGGEKFAKSKGNGILLSSLIDKGYTPTDYRYLLLTSHYRTPVNFTYEALDGAKTALLRLKKTLLADGLKEGGAIHPRYQLAFRQLVNDDLDTPKAVALMWELVKDTEVSAADKIATVQDFDTVFGLGLTDLARIHEELSGVTPEELPAEVTQMMTEREAARAVQNWDEADRLRHAIEYHGYRVEDAADGPKITKI